MEQRVAQVDMTTELAVATAMVLLTVAIHAIGLHGLRRLLRLEAEELDSAHIRTLSLRGFGMTMAIVLGLFVLHGIEIWLYAGLFHLLGAVADFRTAVYFSTISYGAIGYGDAAMAEAWRLVAAIEGINGIILIGWSTAFFVTVVARMGR